VDHSVIMRLTGHKTAAMFHRYNTVDTADTVNAHEKFTGVLAERKQLPVNYAPGQKSAPIVLPGKKWGSRSYPKG
jgi:hypothetical protein